MISKIVVLLMTDGLLYTFPGTYVVHAEQTRGFSSQFNTGQRNMSFIHDATVEVLSTLLDAGSACYRAQKVEKDTLKSVWIVGCYFCNILEGRDMCFESMEM